jgi:hypothetical protein
MESTRRLVIAAALGLVVLAHAASFWGSHAMLTSLIASLLVLAVTVVVLNELLARRDRRRWSVLAQHVLFQGRVDWISDVLAHNEPNEGRSLVRRKLVRSSLAAEHVAILEPDSVHDQIVSTAQLAVRLDYESRALGFKLVPYEEWVKRIHTFVDEPPTLND